MDNIEASAPLLVLDLKTLCNLEECELMANMRHIDNVRSHCATLLSPLISPRQDGFVFMLARAKKTLLQTVGEGPKAKLRMKILLFSTVYQSWDRTDNVVTLHDLYRHAYSAQAEVERTGPPHS